MISKEDLNRLANIVYSTGRVIQIEYTAKGNRVFQALEQDPEKCLEVAVEALDLETFITKCQQKQPIVIDTEITDEMEGQLFHLAKQLNEKELYPAICALIYDKGLNFGEFPDDPYDTGDWYNDFDSFIRNTTNNYCLEEDDNDHE
jgi:hypothetical protein